MPVAPVAIINCAAFVGAAVSGLTAIELEPDSKAAKEMRALWRVVERMARARPIGRISPRT